MNALVPHSSIGSTRPLVQGIRGSCTATVGSFPTASRSFPAASRSFPTPLPHPSLGFGTAAVTRTKVQTHQLQKCHAAAADLPADEGAPQQEDKGEKPKGGIFGKIKRFFIGDGLTKEKLKELGIGAVLSYGLVSNLTYGACIVFAWITHVQRTGMCPLAPGQWKGMLAIYAGLWTIQNFLRPLRFTLALSIAPMVDNLLHALMDRFNVTKRTSFFMCLGGLAVFTLSFVGLSILVLGGFPPAARMA